MFPFPIQTLHSNLSSCSDWVTTNILLFYSEDGSRGSIIKLFIWNLWSIWLHRNERLFSNVNPKANRISQLLRDIVEMNIHLVTFPCFNNPRFLHPPAKNMDSVPVFGVYLGLNHLGSPQHIILFDATWKKETRVMGCAWVVHTPSTTQMENGGGTYGLASSALHAESQAFLKALI